MPLADALVKGNERGVHPDVEFGADHLFGVCPVDFPERHRRCLVYDQAMGVTIALFASLFVAVLVIPVYFMVLYRKKKHVRKER